MLFYTLVVTVFEDIQATTCMQRFHMLDPERRPNLEPRSLSAAQRGAAYMQHLAARLSRISLQTTRCRIQELSFLFRARHESTTSHNCDYYGWFLPDSQQGTAVNNKTMTLRPLNAAWDPSQSPDPGAGQDEAAEYCWTPLQLASRPSSTPRRPGTTARRRLQAACLGGHEEGRPDAPRPRGPGQPERGGGLVRRAHAAGRARRRRGAAWTSSGCCWAWART